MIIIDKINTYKPIDGDIVMDGDSAKKVEFLVPRCKRLKKMKKFRGSGGGVAYKNKSIKSSSVLNEILNKDGSYSTDDFKGEVMLGLGIEQLELDSSKTIWKMLKELKAKGYYLIIR